MKHLRTVQTIAQVGKILSKIVYVLCIIGAVGCLIGAVCLALIPQDAANEGSEIYQKMEESSGMNIGSLTATVAASAVLCLGEIFVAFYAVRYFTNELAAGTPFTEAGARELQSLGIKTIVAPLVALIVSSIVYTVINAVKGGNRSFDAQNEVSIALGIGMLIVSVLLRAAMEAGAGSDPS